MFRFGSDDDTNATRTIEAFGANPSAEPATNDQMVVQQKEAKEANFRQRKTPVKERGCVAYLILASAIRVAKAAAWATTSYLTRVTLAVIQIVTLTINCRAALPSFNHAL
jgi:hypothetical protein